MSGTGSGTGSFHMSMPHDVNLGALCSRDIWHIYIAGAYMTLNEARNDHVGRSIESIFPRADALLYL